MKLAVVITVLVLALNLLPEKESVVFARYVMLVVSVRL